MSYIEVRAIYRAVVIAQMAYGCSIWFTSRKAKGVRTRMLREIETLQGKAARVITGAFRRTSLEALNIEAYLLPIKHLPTKLTEGVRHRKVSSNLEQ